MITMLRRHYLPEGRQPAGIFAPEIQAPTSTRRADLIWQDVTTVGKGRLVGHEVKVARADVLAELADPLKADAWQRYCDEWWLVLADPTLVDGLDVPELWGIMAPPSGRRTRSMTIVRQAPRLQPVDKAPAFETIGKWLHWRLDKSQREHRASQDYAARLNRQLQELHSRMPRESPARQQFEETVATIVAKLGGATGEGRVGRWDGEVEVDDVVAALRDLGSVYQRAERLAAGGRSIARQVERLLGGINRTELAALDTAVAQMRDRPEGAAA